MAKKKQTTKQKIERLKRQIWKLEHKDSIEKNQQTQKIAKKYKSRLKREATAAEKKFYSIARKKNLDLWFQCPIYIREGNYIKKFYIADFCDIKHKMIFEIDGGYHQEESQKEYDHRRTEDLRSLGFQVFRITNEQVFAGKSTAFLRFAYLRIGIDILKKKES